MSRQCLPIKGVYLQEPPPPIAEMQQDCTRQERIASTTYGAPDLSTRNAFAKATPRPYE